MKSSGGFEDALVSHANDLFSILLPDFLFIGQLYRDLLNTHCGYREQEVRAIKALSEH